MKLFANSFTFTGKSITENFRFSCSDKLWNIVQMKSSLTCIGTMKYISSLDVNWYSLKRGQTKLFMVLLQYLPKMLLQTAQES